mmetsp:Transcript_33838/g.110729  ORF Transcript_33838/g.110729 Transcript_33838/m.110729 type:complete len:381 (+) Transcript_33838:398-1540(+)
MLRRHTAAMRLDHVLQLVADGADVADVVHCLLVLEVARHLEGPAQHRAQHHAEAAAAIGQQLGLRAIAVRLLREVREVDAQAEHVALVPIMPLHAMLAIVVAQRGAEPLAARDGAPIRGLDVGRRLEAMLEEHIHDLVVGAVVQLAHGGLLLVLVPQVRSVLLVQLGKGVVLHRVDRHDIRMSSVVEWCALHELVHDLCALGPPQVDLHEAVDGLLRGAVLVFAPARVREAQVAASAKTCDPPGALLFGRAVGVVDTDAALGSGFQNGEAVQTVHEVFRYGLLELDMRLLVLAARDVHPESGRELRRVRGEEGTNVCLELAVLDIGMQVAHPQCVGAGHAHHAWAIRRHMRHLALDLRAPPRQAQCSRELGGRHFPVGPI